MTPAAESVGTMAESTNGGRPPGFLDRSSIPGESTIEQAQRERIAQLEQTVRERDLLVGIISHELRHL